MTPHGNLLGPEPTLLPEDPAGALPDGGVEPAEVAATHPTSALVPHHLRKWRFGGKSTRPWLTRSGPFRSASASASYIHDSIWPLRRAA